MLEGGKPGARVMPGISAGMDQGAMPKMAIAGTRELCGRAEPGWQSKAKGGNRCSARGSRGLYDGVYGLR